MSKLPPKSADRFLGWFCRSELLEEVKGDLHECYSIERTEKGDFKAWWLYWFHVLHFLRPFAIKQQGHPGTSGLNIIIMYKSYFKFAWRNIIKHKASSLMNVMSLSVGIACFIFIFIYLKGEVNYDKFHQDADRIHRVAIDFMDSQGRRVPDATTPPALAPALKSNFPEVASAVRIFPNWGSKFLLGTSPEKRYYEEDLLRTDSTFFDVFSFEMIYGNKATALNNPDQIVLTQTAAIKYFGKEDVIGETLTLFGEENRVYQISGVLKDVPFNSHFRFNFLTRLSFDNMDQNWGWYNYYTYMKLTPEADIAGIEPRLQPFFESNLDEREFYNIIYSQPLTDIHLKSNLKWELEANGNMNNVYIFAALGIFVLLISCLNYLNLSVADSLKRYKEIGVRKVFGAHKGSLVSQFMVETLLLTIISLLLGSLFSEMLFINLSDILGRSVSITTPENLNIFLAISGAIVAISILAGLYPALHLSSFKTINAVKGIVSRSGKSALGLRKSLLVIQFAISAFMIFGTLAVYQQLQHVKNTDKGFDSEQVLVIENGRGIENQKTMKAELAKIANVSGVGVSTGVVGGLNWTTQMGYPNSFTTNYLVTDPEYVETMGFEFLAGRNFSPDLTSDQQGLTVVLNETALRDMGLSYDDIGKTIPMAPQNDTTARNGKIIGVIKDFHFTDFKTSIKPFAFLYRDQAFEYLSVKVATGDMSTTLKEIEGVWSQFGNGVPLEYFFLDQTFAELFAQESKLSNVLLYLTGVALFIAFMGMFAIANLTIKDKKKEIAIRKVLGASASGVSNMITSKFLMLVLVANLIAGPLAYFVMQKWLDGFAYRTELGVAIFLIAIASTLFVAWFTVGFQSFKAAISNPVKSLRQN